MTDEVLVSRALLERVILALEHSRHLIGSLPPEQHAQAYLPMLSGVLTELERAGLGGPPARVPPIGA